MTEDPPFRIHRVGALDHEDKAVDEWVERIDDDVLAATRSLAHAWTTTLSTLFGLLGAGSILGADDAVRSLVDPWHIVFGAFAGAAIVAAALAVYAAHTASQPTQVLVGPSLDERRQVYENLVNRARRWLQASRGAAAVALVLLVIAFAQIQPRSMSSTR